MFQTPTVSRPGQGSPMRWSCLLLLLLLPGLFTACDNEDDDPDPVDVAAPTISSADLQPTSSFGPGQTATLSVSVTDDRGLSQLKVEVHNNFEPHSHKTSATQPFEMSEIVDLSGTTASPTVEIPIPDDASTGPYHLILQALDAAGNQSELMVMEMEITSASRPEIEILTVNGNTPGETIHVHDAPYFENGNIRLELTGAVRDAEGLDKLKVVVLEDDHEHGHEHGKVAEGDHEVFEAEFTSGLGTEVDLATLLTGDNQIQFSLHDGETEGHFKLYIIAEDTEGNHSVAEHEIHAGE